MMKAISSCVFSFSLLVLICGCEVHVPSHFGAGDIGSCRRVSDLARVLPAENEKALNQRLLDLHEQTASSVVILTITDREEDLEEFASKLLRDALSEENSVLILAETERRVVHIEVGVGLQEAFPKALAEEVSRKEIQPLLKDGDFVGAFHKGLDAIDLGVHGELDPCLGATPASELENTMVAYAEQKARRWTNVLWIVVPVLILGALIYN